MVFTVSEQPGKAAEISLLFRFREKKRGWRGTWGGAPGCSGSVPAWGGWREDACPALTPYRSPVCFWEAQALAVPSLLLAGWGRCTKQSQGHGHLCSTRWGHCWCGAAPNAASWALPLPGDCAWERSDHHQAPRMSPMCWARWHRGPLLCHNHAQLAHPAACSLQPDFAHPASIPVPALPYIVLVKPNTK